MKQINMLCVDLERLYKTKIAARTWDGAGREGRSVFLIDKSKDSSGDKEVPAADSKHDQPSACTLHGSVCGNPRQPSGGHGNQAQLGRFMGNCHHCGKRGHKSFKCNHKMHEDLKKMATEKALKTGKQKDINFI